MYFKLQELIRAETKASKWTKGTLLQVTDPTVVIGLALQHPLLNKAQCPSKYHIAYNNALYHVRTKQIFNVNMQIINSHFR